MGEPSDSSIEAENPVLGKVRISSSNLNTIITILSFGFSMLIAWVLIQHTSETKEASKELAGVMKDNAQATREQTCIISQPQEKRPEHAEWCKRMAR